MAQMQIFNKGLLRALLLADILHRILKLLNKDLLFYPLHPYSHLNAEFQVKAL